ncbi:MULTISPECIES: hypothetical protein [Actinomadura]|uniref:Uncharacterized protein n=1 Tax=Actinomadura litoris TaxID=2678616 RepID=A0A7K1L6Q0_9ACTN|nr:MULTISPECIES: hypothetical protein [Actinomadura]MBT2213883.1 hypothetical protein [Actinomadura sp. NEAU-AAG7]MUN39956.1 hypothetical protein [Actinomadura litoris]
MSEADKRDRLRVVEADLDRLRAELPQPTEDAGDFVDAGQNLAAREELSGRIELLEDERRRLRDDLGLD